MARVHLGAANDLGSWITVACPFESRLGPNPSGPLQSCLIRFTTSQAVRFRLSGCFDVFVPQEGLLTDHLFSAYGQINRQVFKGHRHHRLRCSHFDLRLFQLSKSRSLWVLVKFDLRQLELELMDSCYLVFANLDGKRLLGQTGSATDYSNLQASPKIQKIGALDLIADVANFAKSDLYFSDSSNFD